MILENVIDSVTGEMELHSQIMSIRKGVGNGWDFGARYRAELG